MTTNTTTQKQFSYSEYLDGDCSREEYYAQFNPIKLELGQTYVQHRGTWCERHFKIIFQDEKISVGVSVYCKISLKDIGDYEMFLTDSGFKYNDNRTKEYKLEKI